MGSTGSGRFTDYSSGKGSQLRKGGGDAGGVDPNDRCLMAFSVELEDVQHSTYFQQNQALPPVGTKLKIAHRKRIVAVDSNGVAIGNLPTRFNYLADCLAGNQDYIGKVESTVSGNVSVVVASFAPIT